MTKPYERYYYYTLKFMLHEGRLIRKIVAFEKAFTPESQSLIVKPLVSMFLNHETAAMHCIVNEDLDGIALGIYTITEESPQHVYVSGFWIQPPNTWTTLEKAYGPEEICRIIEEEEEGKRSNPTENKTIGFAHQQDNHKKTKEMKEEKVLELEALWEKMRTVGRTDH